MQQHNDVELPALDMGIYGFWVSVVPQVSISMEYVCVLLVRMKKFQIFLYALFLVPNLFSSLLL